MTFTLTYQWWWIPAALTVAAVVWGFLPDNKREDSIAAGLTAIFWATPILLFLCVVWIVAGVLK
jgi:hypothetical protein